MPVLLPHPTCPDIDMGTESPQEEQARLLARGHAIPVPGFKIRFRLQWESTYRESREFNNQGDAEEVAELMKLNRTVAVVRVVRAIPS